MPISSLVVTLDADSDLRESALAALRVMRGVTVGELRTTRLPVVLETATLQEGHEFVDHALRHIEGVRFVDIVRIDFEDMNGGSWNDDDS